MGSTSFNIVVHADELVPYTLNARVVNLLAPPLLSSHRRRQIDPTALLVATEALLRAGRLARRRKKRGACDRGYRPRGARIGL